MITGIFLYYLWILIALYLWYVLFFCTYEHGEKVRYELWMLILFFIGAFIPLVNFGVVCALIWMMIDLKQNRRRDIEFHNFLFRKV